MSDGWRGGASLRVEVEVHGRVEPRLPAVRSIGWLDVWHRESSVMNHPEYLEVAPPNLKRESVIASHDSHIDRVLQEAYMHRLTVVLDSDLLPANGLSGLLHFALGNKN